MPCPNAINIADTVAFVNLSVTTCMMITPPPSKHKLASDKEVGAMILEKKNTHTHKYTTMYVCVGYLPGCYGNISPVAKLIEGVA